MAPDGRFRLGSLAGAWTKPQALYIGQRARAAARQQRIAAIEARLGEIARELQGMQREFEKLEGELRQAEMEWSRAPHEQALYASLHAATAAARVCHGARSQLDRAEAQCRAAELKLQIAREALDRDADDLRLPVDAEKLSTIETVVQRCVDDQYRLVQSAREWRRAFPELSRQEEREADAKAQFDESHEQLAVSRLRPKKPRRATRYCATPWAPMSIACASNWLMLAELWRLGTSPCGKLQKTAVSPANRGHGRVLRPPAPNKS